MTKSTEQALREAAPFEIPREELAAINRDATRRWRRDRRVRWLIIALSPLGMLTVIFGRRIFPLHPEIAFITGWALLATALIAMMMSVRSRHHHHLRRVLRERGYEVCATCGYKLAELGADVRRCPECGAERVSLEGPGT